MVGPICFLRRFVEPSRATTLSCALPTGCPDNNAPVHSIRRLIPQIDLNQPIRPRAITVVRSRLNGTLHASHCGSNSNSE
jgi:hypothetical protein